jgi:hypothetical protein
MGYLFTSESVSEGHPDKVADQISDAVLDKLLAFDPSSKVACETLVTTGQVVLAGEVKTKAYVDLQRIAREVINRIGYTKSEYIGIQRRTDRFATYPLAIGYHPDRTTCRQTGRESTSRIAGRHRHGHLRYRPIHTLFASPTSGRMEYHLANGTLWYGLRAVPDAQ